jgi:hypothetical protein
VCCSYCHVMSPAHPDAPTCICCGCHSDLEGCWDLIPKRLPAFCERLKCCSCSETVGACCDYCCSCFHGDATMESKK